MSLQEIFLSFLFCFLVARVVRFYYRPQGRYYSEVLLLFFVRYALLSGQGQSPAAAFRKYRDVDSDLNRSTYLLRNREKKTTATYVAALFFFAWDNFLLLFWGSIPQHLHVVGRSSIRGSDEVKRPLGGVARR